MKNSSIYPVFAIALLLLISTSQSQATNRYSLAGPFEHEVNWTRDTLPCRENDKIETVTGKYSDEVIHVFTCNLAIKYNDQIVGDFQIYHQSEPDKGNQNGPRNSLIRFTRIRIQSMGVPLGGANLEEFDSFLNYLLGTNNKEKLMDEWKWADRISDVVDPTNYTNDKSYFSNDHLYGFVTKWYDVRAVSNDWFVKNQRPSFFIPFVRAFRHADIYYCPLETVGEYCESRWRQPIGDGPPVHAPRQYR